ncbi:hypothetical protein [Streptomyces sp. Ag82_O1-15]|uniref:hypothetical protein n=1 Tax=Streptomyces sp. Ag82_O1-15 TaxID=1938855 RepID=UPI0027B9A2C1|nr:hypothetical protein [Streptomyces sp. Ag82_O1-15]
MAAGFLEAVFGGASPATDATPAAALSVPCLLHVHQHGVVVLQGTQLLLQGFDLHTDTFLLLGVALKVARHLGDVL